MISPKEKTCRHCKRSYFPQRKNGQAIVGKQWESSKYCSHRCVAIGGGGITNLRNPLTDEKRRLSLAKAAKGRPMPRVALDASARLRKGKPLSVEHRKKLSILAQGIEESEWIGFTTQASKLERSKREYKEFRRAMYSRDGFACQDCGIRGGVLNLEHIKPWSLYPELRYEPSNVKTLCLKCHQKTPTYRLNTKNYGHTAAN